MNVNDYYLKQAQEEIVVYRYVILGLLGWIVYMWWTA